MSGVSWESDDLGDVAVIMEAVSPSPAIPGLAGIYGPNDGVDTAPKPSDDSNAPTVYAIWRVDYAGKPEGDFGGNEPVRQGVVLVAIRQQLGSGIGFTKQLGLAIMAAFASQTVSGLEFFPDEARPQPGGEDGPWNLHIYSIPFVGA